MAATTVPQLLLVELVALRLVALRFIMVDAIQPAHKRAAEEDMLD